MPDLNLKLVFTGCMLIYSDLNKDCVLDLDFRICLGVLHFVSPLFYDIVDYNGLVFIGKKLGKELNFRPLIELW